MEGGSNRRGQGGLNFVNGNGLNVTPNFVNNHVK